MSETVTQVNETTQQIVRSRTCGLKDFYIALVQSNTATAYTAGTPVKLARAIKAKIDEKWTSEKIYSDDNTEGGHHLIRGNRCRTGDQCSCTAGQSDSVRAVVRERILEKVI